MIKEKFIKQGKKCVMQEVTDNLVDPINALPSLDPKNSCIVVIIKINVIERKKTIPIL